MSPTVLLLLGLAFFGHLSLWVAAHNRLLALGLTGELRRVVIVGLPVCVVAVPWVLWPGIVVDEPSSRDRFLGLEPSWPWTAYAVLCWSAAFVQIAYASHRRFSTRAPDAMRSRHGRLLDIAREIGGPPIGPGLRTKLLTRLPGNEVFRLELTEKQIELGRLPEELDGLSIVHLSDLHFSGAIDKEYFREVVRRTNQMQPDLIALTGDFVDYPRCVDWIVDILAPLEATFGAYFVLGNHDLRVDEGGLRQTLADAGLVDLGGRTTEITIRGKRVVLAGNESPWFPLGPEMNLVTGDEAREASLRLLLAHTPDRYHWARQRGFDLMLAGHTHGGQIRLPFLGAWVCPSLHGVRYASGVFHEPPTVMHVSRGVSSLLPLRLRCPPEVTRLVLRAPIDQKSPEGASQSEPLTAADPN